MTVATSPTVPARSAAAPQPSAGGWLRLFAWLVPERRTEGHAYLRANRVITRSVCDLAPWNVKAVPVVDAQLCPICVAIVRGAIAGMTSELEDLERRGPCEGEQRADWGNR